MKRVDRLQLPKGSPQHCTPADMWELHRGQQWQSRLTARISLVLNRVYGRVTGEELCRKSGIIANYEYTPHILAASNKFKELYGPWLMYRGDDRNWVDWVVCNGVKNLRNSGGRYRVQT